MTGLTGLAGLGVMGSAMAQRLADSGWSVVATSRSAATRQAAVRPGVMEVLATPADVVARLAERLPAGGDLVVLVSVTAGAQVRDVVLGPAGLLAGVPAGRRLVIADTSTCSPADARHLARLLDDAGHLAVDAPVSGGPSGARAGSLSVMAGGSPEALRAARPVLAALAGLLTECGGPGSGQVVKAANQLVVACTLSAVAEALTLAQACGVAPATTRAALLAGYACSRVLHAAGGRMVSGDFEPGGSAALLDKDVAIITALAAETGLRVSGLAAVAAQVRELASRSPDLDHSALITLLHPQRPS